MLKRIRIIPHHRDEIDLDRLATTLLAIVDDFDASAIADLARRGRELVAETPNGTSAEGAA